MKLWVNKQGTVIPARAGGSAFLCGLCALCGESFLRGSILILEAHPERAFWEIRASKTKGLWFKKRPKTLFPDASLEAHPERAFWEIRASKTKGLWFKKRPKTLFPDASLETHPESPMATALSRFGGPNARY